MQFIIQKILKIRQLRREFEQEALRELHAQHGHGGGRRNAAADDLLGLSNTEKCAFDSPQGIMRLLNFREQRALRVTWRHMKGTTGLRGVTQLMARNFEKLLKRKPKINAVFYRAAFLLPEEGRPATTMHEHAKLFANYLDVVIYSEQYPANQQVSSTTIGQAHRAIGSCGFDADMWEYFGQTFSELILLQDCVRAHPFAPRAWNILIAALTDQFRAAYEQQCRRDSLGLCTPEAKTRRATLKEYVRVSLNRQLTLEQNVWDMINRVIGDLRTEKEGNSTDVIDRKRENSEGEASTSKEQIDPKITASKEKKTSLKNLVNSTLPEQKEPQMRQKLTDDETLKWEPSRASDKGPKTDELPRKKIMQHQQSTQSIPTRKFDARCRFDFSKTPDTPRRKKGLKYLLQKLNLGKKAEQRPRRSKNMFAEGNSLSTSEREIAHKLVNDALEYQPSPAVRDRSQTDQLPKRKVSWNLPDATESSQSTPRHKYQTTLGPNFGAPIPNSASAFTINYKPAAVYVYPQPRSTFSSDSISFCYTCGRPNDT